VPREAGIGKLGRKRAGFSVLPTKCLADEMDGIATQRSGIVPSFPKNRLGIADGGSLDCQLNVVPRRMSAVDLRHLYALRVSHVIVVIPTSMTEVNPTDEGDVAFWVMWVPQNNQFLVMGPDGADPHIKEAIDLRRLQSPHLNVGSRWHCTEIHQNVSATAGPARQLRGGLQRRRQSRCQFWDLEDVHLDLRSQSANMSRPPASMASTAVKSSWK